MALDCGLQQEQAVKMDLRPPKPERIQCETTLTAKGKHKIGHQKTEPDHHKSNTDNPHLFPQI